MRIFALFFMAFLLANSSAASRTVPEPKTLLEKSDRARGGVSKGMSWEISINANQAGSKSETKFNIKVKDVNVLARCTAPARQKDEVYLFNDRNLWVFRPGLRKPISVSPRQRLSGQAANGDIANTNYARDYEGNVVGQEVVDGKPAWKLKLKAKAANTTYDAINYWISVEQNLGLKAEFLTTEGKVFKTAVVEYNNKVGTVPFISKMTITDAAFKENVTTMTYTNPKSEEISDSIFNVNNLAR